MKTLLAALLLGPALALAQVPIRPPGTQPTAPQRPSVRPMPPPPGPGAPTPTSPQRPVTGPGEGTVRTTDQRCVPLQGRFMLTFNKADIVDVLEQASRWTCRNFVYTEDVARGKITLLSKTAVTADEAYAAFLAALNSNNIAVYATGRYYKLIRNADAKKNPIPTYTDGESGTPANEQPLTKVVKLQYSDADQLRGILGNFISPQGADIQSIPPDTLIITDIGLNLRRLERIIESIDKAGAGDLVRIVQVRFASAKDIADKLNQIFQAQSGAAGGRARRSMMAASPGATQPARPGPVVAPTVTPGAGAPVEVSVSKILPDDRTNKLIIIADDKSFGRILELVEQLDVPTSADGGIHVVFLKNANAEDLAQTLSNLAQGQAKKPGAPGGAPVVPGAVTPAGIRPGATPGAPAGAGADVPSELFSGDVKITSDKTQNALLVQASGADFSAIQRLIDKLDRPRRQVFVEAVIMEVNLRDETHFGVGAHTAATFKYKGQNGVLPLASEPGSVSSLNLSSVVSLGGFLTGFVGPVSAELKDLGLNLPSIGVLVQALQSNSDVNVLSTPHIVATDNEDSEITIGQNVPFQAGFAPQGLSSLLGGAGATGANQSTLGSALGLGGLSSLYAPIQRQNVELRLKIKPQINEGGNVRLTIEEQTEEIADRDPQLGPTTAKRSVKTQIVARDQSTIVLGGMYQERNVRSVRKIPFLGSLPVIGWLFRDTQNTKQKTNLLLFLTPYIIRDEADYRRIYEKKRREQQEFTEQFYGRRAGFEVDVDFTRKAGPYSRLHRGVEEESRKLENGGGGGPDERVTSPPGAPRPGEEQPAGTPPPAPLQSPRPRNGNAPPPKDEGTPVDRLEVQPDVPEPGARPPGPGPGAPQGEPAPGDGQPAQ
jgi:general secretion pathway protein D